MLQGTSHPRKESAASLISEGSRLFKAASLVLAVRVGLRLLPFSTLRRLLDPRRSKRGEPGSEATAREVRAVEQMSHYLAGANCLTRALATQRVLRRHGREARLRLGVRKCGEHKLDAHAWLETDDGLYLGEASIREAYKPLPPLDAGGAPGR